MVTEYEYDDGRLVRSVTTSEPRWTEQDRAEALALAVHREGQCPLCKRPLDVCTADEHKGAPEFVAEYTMCRATAAILEQQRAFAKSKTANPNAPAFLWAASTARRRPR
jgi:hypothetical protein